jgi:cell division protein ZapA (FtsZ GTPase activity inhibitor)
VPEEVLIPMNTLSIDILGRSYTLSVNEKEAVAVTKAAEELRERLALLRSRYQVQDPVDLLAMSALNLLAESKSEPKASTAPISTSPAPIHDLDSWNKLQERLDQLIGLFNNQDSEK